MFYYLYGKTEIVDSTSIVVDCNGVGYLVYTSFNTISKIKGSQEKIYTYASVREDAFDIYGFLTSEELNLFKMLISVSGVGPKAAISILSALSIEALVFAISNGDFKKLTQAQGIGAKIAQRVVLELKDKIKKESISTDSNEIFSQPNSSDKYSEAKAALITLGYSSSQASEVLRSIDMSLMSVEDIIRQALRQLMK